MMNSQKSKNLKFFARCTRSKNDQLNTKTSLDQKEVEVSVDRCYDSVLEDNTKELKILLKRDDHLNYLKNSLIQPLSQYMSALDASRPWMVYWISLPLYILGENKFLKDNDHKIIKFLKKCQSPKGGYGGGPNQEPHLAATYAAVNALVTVGTKSALESIDRENVRKFLCSMQNSDGSFLLHEKGEVDIRGAYCALSVAKLLNISLEQSKKDDLFLKTGDWLLSCQTYEGGFGAGPGHEAHGGYTFCGVAALVFLDQLHRCDIDALMRWVVFKQLSFEGGFCGRTNKLVDGCYSFWAGAVLPIIQGWMTAKENIEFDRWIFNQEALQEYILVCCQAFNGGMIDKPGKRSDFYHTAYTLSGYSIAQYSGKNRVILNSDDRNLVEPVFPLFNVPIDSFQQCQKHFRL